MDVNEELQRIKRHMTELRGTVDTGNPNAFLNLALARDQVDRWLEEEKERIRLLKEILVVIKETMSETDASK